MKIIREGERKTRTFADVEVGEGFLFVGNSRPWMRVNLRDATNCVCLETGDFGGALSSAKVTHAIVEVIVREP